MALINGSPLLPKVRQKSRDKAADFTSRSTWNWKDDIVPSPCSEDIDPPQFQLQADEVYPNQDSNSTFEIL
jgi:hypothetical protein